MHKFNVIWIFLLSFFSLNIQSNDDVLQTIRDSFVNIPSGDFIMGSPKDEWGRMFNERQHPVTLSKNFQMMSKEVSQLQWFAIMGDNPSTFNKEEHCDDHIVIGEVSICPNNPVENVSWYRVKEFIRKFNEIEGENIYQLPTEAQWEFSTRGGTTSAYFFGKAPDRLDTFSWYFDNSMKQTHPVDTHRVNPFMLKNMHGNTWEWTEDWYTDFPEGGIDPKGPSTGTLKVIRGGGWLSLKEALRSAFRYYVKPGCGYKDVGFRLVRIIQ